MIHESDKIENEDQYQQALIQFNNILYDPWANINFSKIPNLVLSKKIGQGLGITPFGPGFIREKNFLLNAPIFNKAITDNNNVVIHLRRGNASAENPRHTEDEFYLNLLSQMNKLFNQLNINPSEVIVCTDAPSQIKTFEPKKDQRPLWNQRYLIPNKDGKFPVFSANFNEFLKVFPKLKIYNDLCTYDSFMLMVKARVLITSNSSFSQSAGLLNHNMVIGHFVKDGITSFYNTFKNKVGTVDNKGNFIF